MKVITLHPVSFVNTHEIRHPVHSRSGTENASAGPEVAEPGSVKTVTPLENMLAFEKLLQIAFWNHFILQFSYFKYVT